MQEWCSQDKATTSLVSPRFSRGGNSKLSGPKAGNLHEWLGRKDVGCTQYDEAVLPWWNTGLVLPDFIDIFKKKPEVLSFWGWEELEQNLLTFQWQIKSFGQDLQLQTFPSWVTSWYPTTSPNETLKTCSSLPSYAPFQKVTETSLGLSFLTCKMDLMDLRMSALFISHNFPMNQIK